jgi:hypothetical protein
VWILLRWRSEVGNRHTKSTWDTSQNVGVWQFWHFFLKMSVVITKIGIAKIGIAKIGIAKIGIAKIGIAKIGIPFGMDR